MYKIKNREGLFSNGKAGRVTWGKHGKIWKTLPMLKVHLSAMYHRERLGIYDNCDIVKCEITEIERMPSSDVIEEVKLKELYNLLRK